MRAPRERILVTIAIALSVIVVGLLIVVSFDAAPFNRIIAPILAALAVANAVFYGYLYQSGTLSRTFRDKKRLAKEIDAIMHLYRETIISLEEKNEYLLEKWGHIEHARREQTKDLALAKRIQTNILPKKFPAIDGVEFASFYQPIEEVGGDFFDVTAISDSTVLFIIADVCGHGVSAALVTAMVKSTWQALVGRYPTPASLMREMNVQLSRNLESIQYLTAVIGKIDANERVFAYANASHPSPLLARNRVVTELAPQKNTILGKFEHAQFTETSIPLESMDKLLFYTDGIVEASRDKNKREQYGVERLKASFRTHADNDLAYAVERIKNDFRDYSTLRKPDDDFSFLAVAFVPPYSP